MIIMIHKILSGHEDFFRRIWVIGISMWAGAALLTYILLKTGMFYEATAATALVQSALGLEVWISAVFILTALFAAIVHLYYGRLYNKNAVWAKSLAIGAPISFFAAWFIDFAHDLLMMLSMM